MSLATIIRIVRIRRGENMDIPEMRSQLITDDDREGTRRVLYITDSPHEGLIQAYVEAMDLYHLEQVHHDIYIKKKYESLDYQPSIVEKTMTDGQLVAAGSPEWMKRYSPLVIELIDEACQLLDAEQYEDYHDVLLDVARETGIMSATALKDLVVAELMCRM